MIWLLLKYLIMKVYFRRLMRTLSWFWASWLISEKISPIFEFHPSPEDEEGRIILSSLKSLRSRVELLRSSFNRIPLVASNLEPLGALTEIYLETRNDFRTSRVMRIFRPSTMMDETRKN